MSQMDEERSLRTAVSERALLAGYHCFTVGRYFRGSGDGVKKIFENRFNLDRYKTEEAQRLYDVSERLCETKGEGRTPPPS